MPDPLVLSFSFGAGVAAFFSPCAVTLLPGYVTYYLSAKSTTHSLLPKVLNAAWFASKAILGFFTVFGTAGALVILLGQQVKQFIPLVTIVTGLLLIILGAGMLLGKDLFLRLPSIGAGERGAYPFGIGYAVAALGCTFPLFVTVLVQGIVANSLVSGMLSLLAYILGMSLLLICVTVATAIGREFVQKRISGMLPYIKKASGLIIIGAGAYMIYYQALLWL